MTTCLYDCNIWHRRLLPKKNSFTVSTFMFLVDLNEHAAQLSSGDTHSSLVRRLYSLRNEDHIDASARDLREKLRDYISTVSSELASRITNIKLLAHLRFLNFVFNPISVFYCFDQNQELLATVVEVENTFRERKLYLLDGDDKSKRSFNKEFYVSPFSSVDGQFEFAIDEPGDMLNLNVTFSEKNQVTFEAGMRAKRLALTQKTLAVQTLKHPCSSLLAWLGIHLHALALYLKRFPYYEKNAEPLLQKPNYQKSKSS